MNRLKTYYLFEWNFFRKRLFLFFIIIFVIMSASTYLGYSYYLIQPDKKGDQSISYADKAAQQVIDTVHKFGPLKFLGIFLLNLKSCLAVTILGAIPFLFLTIPGIFSIYFNTGILLAPMKYSFGSIYSCLLFIIPHGIFERSAVIYSGCLGVYLTIGISRKIFSKYRNKTVPFLEMGKNVLSSYCLVIIPLLALASITETFVTPRIVEISPKDAKFCYILANAHYNKKEYDLAISNYSKVLNMNPNHAEAYSRRGSAYSNKGWYDQAISDYSKALELNPNDVETYNCRANAYFSKDEYEQGISDSNKAIEINPKDITAYNNLAWIFATAKEPRFRNGKKAVELALRASELSDWKNPNHLGVLAAAYARVGDFDNAIKWEEKALQLYTGRKTVVVQQRLKLYKEHKPWPPD